MQAFLAEHNFYEAVSGLRINPARNFACVFLPFASG